MFLLLQKCSIRSNAWVEERNWNGEFRPSSAAVNIGTAEPLFDLGSRLPRRGLDDMDNVFDVSPDGQRFLFILPQNTSPEALTLVVNWPSMARR